MPTSTPLLPDSARRAAAWCGVVLLVVGVAAVAIWLVVVLKTAVTPVLLALLGTALPRTIACIDAVCITVGLLILDVPGAVGLGALVFVGAYIPYLGAFLSGAVAVLVALADRGFVIALWALGVVLAVQVLEGRVLQPMIQSRTVQMHPAMVMIALTAGASVAGLLGMLLAVPLCAAAFGVLGELRGRGHSGPPGAHSGPPNTPMPGPPGAHPGPSGV
ncbi:hypothetical protein SBADM41S_03829 [Streptomyces badius]